jgi:hypothetical protein
MRLHLLSVSRESTGRSAPADVCEESENCINRLTSFATVLTASRSCRKMAGTAYVSSALAEVAARGAVLCILPAQPLSATAEQLLQSLRPRLAPVRELDPFRSTFAFLLARPRRLRNPPWPALSLRARPCPSVRASTDLACRLYGSESDKVSRPSSCPREMWLTLVQVNCSFYLKVRTSLAP